MTEKGTLSDPGSSGEEDLEEAFSFKKAAQLHMRWCHLGHVHLTRHWSSSCL